MYGHVSWETSENMVTWEREFVLEKTMEYIELMNKKPDSEVI